MVIISEIKKKKNGENSLNVVFFNVVGSSILLNESAHNDALLSLTVVSNFTCAC